MVIVRDYMEKWKWIFSKSFRECYDLNELKCDSQVLWLCVTDNINLDTRTVLRCVRQDSSADITIRLNFKEREFYSLGNYPGLLMSKKRSKSSQSISKSVEFRAVEPVELTVDMLTWFKKPYSEIFLFTMHCEPYRRWHWNDIRRILKTFYVSTEIWFQWRLQLSPAWESCSRFQISFSSLISVQQHSILLSNVTILVSLETSSSLLVERVKKTSWKLESKTSQRTNDDEDLLYEFYDFFTFYFSFPSSLDIKNQ